MELESYEIKPGMQITTTFGTINVAEVEEHGTIYIVRQRNPYYVQFTSDCIPNYITPMALLAKQERSRKFDEYMKPRTPKPGLKKGKIDISRWKEDIQPAYDSRQKYYYLNIKLEDKWKKDSRFGRSTAEVLCPFCDFIQKIYIWSFAGCGKRCDNCGVHLGHHRATAEEKRFMDFESFCTG